MNKSALDTPVLFLIFNRPDTTQQVFNEIRKARPKMLFVAADGPREGKEGEFEKCGIVRDIIKQVDWECEVKTLFREKNLGCKVAVSSAIDWFFENVEEGIILEDDCLPNITFFRFCHELLDYYRNDTRVMHIAGSNFHLRWERDSYSYYFSYYGSIWGWASWKRAWKKYDVKMTLYPEIRDKGYLYDMYWRNDESDSRRKILEALYSGNIDTWDYQWSFARQINNGLSIIPNMNLVSNIGFDKDGTHIKSAAFDKRANLPVSEMTFPLIHPKFVIRDRISDNKYYEKFIKNNYTAKLKSFVKSIVSCK